MSSKNYKLLLNKITTFVFDVDGVLTNGKILVTTEGEMYREMNTRDGFALKYALLKGFNIGIISGGTNQGVKKRLENLGVNKVYLGIHEKDIALDDFINTYNINPDEVLYMGDDVPDMPVMEKVGVATCPQDAVPDVKRIADYVSHKNGGDGCVREIVEQVMRVQNKWMFSENTNP
ncbi:HAD-IIIA family hydrolase [Flavobacteriaceae bacterium]|jgi:3-deoxy-D-manno-octulosonate 8-phosphate phosphatase (KDO 8-P phosphatase)|nr:HAD-IIIA family hydrolase [Flavobacteriaceae bacterium]MDA8763752.1 HAD-IIIA family hydrolase [Flavobacteriaceae bacterium]MDB2314144.1 HAD-IIIA family hydrolase [Flavobacteriaceae bacterium]MDB2520867.1 HAD-IIIA family hydrolase [Flavobacteriaceae bacterium]